MSIPLKKSPLKHGPINISPSGEAHSCQNWRTFKKLSQLRRLVRTGDDGRSMTGAWRQTYVHNRLDIDVKATERLPEPARQALLIEDDGQSADYTASQLRDFGWRVDTLADGAEGLHRAVDPCYDVIIVDRMLPSMDGLSIVRALRAKDIQTPVVFITAMGSVNDRVDGLEGGGDDYLVKPFSMAELRARLNVLIRRQSSREVETTTLRVKSLTLYRLHRSVALDGAAVDLLPLEYRLLEYILMRLDSVVTRSMLLQDVWGFKFDPQTNIVESHISRLRSKIDRRGQAPLITTVRGAGYVVSST